MYVCFPLLTKFEFKFGLRRLGHSKVIPVVMEEGMRNTSLWKGLLGAEIGNLLYVDMASDDEVTFVGKCEELYRRIAGILHFDTVSCIKELDAIPPPKSTSRNPLFVSNVKTSSAGVMISSPPVAMTRDIPGVQIFLKDSLILSDSSDSSLMSLIPDDVHSASLLYRGSQDGFSREVFHSKCDNQGPLIIIVKCNEGYIFGGYAAVNMPPGNGQWIADASNTSFLFSLKNPKGEVPKKYPIKREDNIHAVCLLPGAAFVFGNNNNAMYSMNMQFVHFVNSATYEDYGEGNLRFTGKDTSKITEVEVWKVARLNDAPLNRELGVGTPPRWMSFLSTAVKGITELTVSSPSVTKVGNLSAVQIFLKDSLILTDSTAFSLMSFMPGSVLTSSLLYRGSQDGFSREVFHSKCDNQGPLIIIVKCNEGYIFGGYAAVNMPPGNGQWIADASNTSFLFSLKNPKGEVPKKYPIKREDNIHAVCLLPGAAFVFGNNNNAMYSMNMQFVHFVNSATYEDYGEGNLRFTGKDTSKITEVEVWKIKM
jgi:predicted nucleic-acid-binding Zn-ribbon protein